MYRCIAPQPSAQNIIQVPPLGIDVYSVRGVQPGPVLGVKPSPLHHPLQRSSGPPWVWRAASYSSSAELILPLNTYPVVCVWCSVQESYWYFGSLQCSSCRTPRQMSKLDLLAREHEHNIRRTYEQGKAALAAGVQCRISLFIILAARPMYT